MRIQAKWTNGSIYIETNEYMSIQELKQFISNETCQQTDRVVYKGRILSNDQETIKEAGISEGDIVHVVRTNSSPVTPSAPVVDPIDGLMENPMVQAMLSNPQYIKSILQSDPRFQKMAEEHPELHETMNDPSFLKEMSDAAKNPKLMQEMMRNQDRTISNIESIPGGFNHLSSMFRSMEDPGRSPDPSTEEANRQLANRLGANIPLPVDRPNSEALPNPWAPYRNKRNSQPSTTRTVSFPTTPMSSSYPQMMMPHISPQTNQPQQLNHLMQNFQQMLRSSQPVQPFDLPSMSTFNMSPTTLTRNNINNTITTTESEAIEVRYRQQLSTMRDMGFTDDEKNKRALLAAAGNTEAAIAYLLDQ